MSLSELHYLIAAGVATLILKIVWDWLANRVQKKENGHLDSALERIEISLARLETVQEEMNTRQSKMWESMLRHRNAEVE